MYCSVMFTSLTSLAVWIWTEFLSESGTYICRGEFTATFAWWHLNVHLSVQLYTPTGPALTVQPRRRWQLSADVARCAATCDVGKLAQHRWHLAVGWKGKEFYQLQLTTDCDQLIAWQTWSADGSGHALMTSTPAPRSTDGRETSIAAL